MDNTRMILYPKPYTFLILFCLTSIIDSLKCGHKLDGISTSSLPVEGRFWITVTSLNRTEIVDQYMPDTIYTVTIESKTSGPEGPQQFTRFLLTLENKNDSLTAGTFDLEDELLTQFSEKCPSAVIESSQIPKSDVSVIWTSPPEGSGCMVIRAIVVENAESWFTGEGGLEKTICQDPKAMEDDPGPILPECCACDEAKYEVTFEGLWSRNTHPKDFPSKGWLIRFSDVIGASHTVDYSFWKQGETASAGLQQVAEFGSTRKLESELKGKSDKIRTIIKARGITYPNVTGQTFAVFRVDNKHHLMSLVSMIVPSPDWIVGVSGLELCLSNCSWIEHKELNLYPFDAGTDDGITYTSADIPTDPPEPIRLITSTYPNDSRSPFYDPSGLDMKPMAKLHLNRQRLYEKACEEVSEGNTDPDEKLGKRHRKACKTTQWGTWGSCPSKCGAQQLRQRNYKDPLAAAAANCTVPLTDRRLCRRNDPHCIENGEYPAGLDKQECQLDEWSTWTDCSSTCGEGYQMRSRNFIHKKHRKHCRAVLRGPELEQTIPCQIEPCPDAEFDNKCPADRYHHWSNWAPCTSTCGEGVTVRSRQPIEESYKGPDECKTQMSNCTAQIISCDITQQEATEICNEPVVIGDCNGRYKRVYFDPKTEHCRFFDYSGCKGNRNNFLTIEECNKVCIDYERHAEDQPFNGIKSGSQIASSASIYDNGERVDCRYTNWSEWTRCNNCRGYTYRRRQILVPAQNGGSRCPTKLLRKKRCRTVLNCSSDSGKNESEKTQKQTSSRLKFYVQLG